MPLPVPPDGFELKIWTDVAAGEDPLVPYSHPDRAVWSFMAMAPKYDEVLVGYDKNPTGEPNEAVFRYSVRIPEEAWFKQPDYNEVFWLSVQAIYNDFQLYPWGWTNHKHQFNDDAVSGQMSADGTGWSWTEILDQTRASADMSFMLFTDPDVCNSCADYNLDNIVNFLDYADFADDWEWVGSPGCFNNTDLNCDGVGDFKDLAIFVNQWLTYCP